MISFFIKDLCSEIQIIYAFIIGIFSGIISSSIEIAIFFLVIVELFIFLETKYFPKKYLFEIRFVITCSYILGWMFGRWIYYGNIGFTHYYDI
jgi:hypothetical protein